FATRGLTCRNIVLTLWMERTLRAVFGPLPACEIGRLLCRHAADDTPTRVISQRSPQAVQTAPRPVPGHSAPLRWGGAEDRPGDPQAGGPGVLRARRRAALPALGLGHRRAPRHPAAGRPRDRRRGAPDRGRPVRLPRL